MFDDCRYFKKSILLATILILKTLKRILVKIWQKDAKMALFALFFCHCFSVQAQKNKIQKVPFINKPDTLTLRVEENLRIKIRRDIKHHTKLIDDELIHEYRSIAIRVYNPWLKTLNIVVGETIPDIKDTELVFEMEENSDATVDYNRNKLFWDFALKPKEAKIIVLSYRVHYPKGKTIIDIKNVFQIQTYKRKAI